MHDAYWIDARGDAPLLLTCEHASARLPSPLDASIADAPWLAPHWGGARLLPAAKYRPHWPGVPSRRGASTASTAPSGDTCSHTPSLASSRNITEKRAGYSNYGAQGCSSKLKAVYQSSRLFIKAQGCLSKLKAAL